MKAEISDAQFVIVLVVQVPLEVLLKPGEPMPRYQHTLKVTRPVLPLHLGSLASSQPRIVGSFT